jgi:ATP-dependent Clp protease adaptor protein ClpS
MEKEETGNQTKEKKHKDDYVLILFNDEINTFDHVIRALSEVCGHDACQAEQCTMIAHLKGSCEVKTGPAASMNVMSKELGKRDLNSKVVKG